MFERLTPNFFIILSMHFKFGWMNMRMIDLMIGWIESSSDSAVELVFTDGLTDLDILIGLH